MWYAVTFGFLFTGLENVLYSVKLCNYQIIRVRESCVLEKLGGIKAMCSAAECVHGNLKTVNSS